MENALVAVMLVALLTFATSTLSRASLGSVAQLSDSWKAMETNSGERSRTYFTLLDASTDVTGTNVYLTFRNDGQTRIDDFSNMDLIVQYYSPSSTFQVAWLPYTSGVPGSNQWSITTISPDVYEPGLVNPGETMIVQAKLSPAVGVGTTNWATLATKHGVGLTSYFLH